MAATVVKASDLVSILVERGIVPENCRRVVIDADFGCPVVVYYDTFADDRILDVFREASKSTIVSKAVK